MAASNSISQLNPFPLSVSQGSYIFNQVLYCSVLSDRSHLSKSVAIAECQVSCDLVRGASRANDLHDLSLFLFRLVFLEDKRMRNPIK